MSRASVVSVVSVVSLLGTSAHADGLPPGSGYGQPSKRSVSRVTLGTPKLAGTYDLTMLRRYVKRMTPSLAYCYEQQLMKDAKLAGTVTATFTIEADGKVVTASAKGLHADVEACVAKVMRRIEFPKPAAGATIGVTYPIAFARNR